MFLNAFRIPDLDHRVFNIWVIVATLLISCNPSTSHGQLPPAAETFSTDQDSSSLSTSNEVIILFGDTEIIDRFENAIMLPAGERARFLEFTPEGARIASFYGEEGIVKKGAFIRPDAMVSVYANVKPIEIDDSTALLMWYSTLRSLGLDEVADEVLDVAIQKFPNNSKALLQRARRLTSKKQYDRALLVVEQCKQLESQNVHVWCLAAKSYVSLKEWKKAEESVKHALKIQPNSARANILAGYLARKQGEFEKAAKFYSLAIEAAPSYSDSYRKRAYVSGQLQQYEQAAEDICRMMTLDSSTWDVSWNVYGQTAEKWANEALKISPKNANALALLASLSTTLEQATARIDQTLAINTRHPIALFLKAKASRDRDEEIRNLQLAVNSGFSNARAFYDLGMHFRMKGKVNAATKALRECILVDPSHRDSRISLAELLLHEKQFSSALAQLELALIQLESTPDKDVFQGAIAPLYSVLSLIHTGRRESLDGLGKVDDAKQAFTLALRACPVAQDVRSLQQSAFADVMYSSNALRHTWESSHYSAVQLESAIISQLQLPNKSEREAKADFVRVSRWGIEWMIPEYAERLKAVNIRDANGNTPLIGASETGSLRSAVQILKLGGDPNYPSMIGDRIVRYPLHESLKTKNYVLSFLLLEAGADATLAQWDGKSALDIAADVEEIDIHSTDDLFAMLRKIFAEQLRRWDDAILVMEAKADRIAIEARQINVEYEREMREIAGMIAANSTRVTFKKTDAWVWSAVPVEDRPITLATTNGMYEYSKKNILHGYPNGVPMPADLANDGLSQLAIRFAREDQFCYALAAFRLAELVYDRTDPEFQRTAARVTKLAEGQ